MAEYFEGSCRTQRREDGSYASLDLVRARSGDRVTIITEQGTHTLIKGEVEEYTAALEGWIREAGEQVLGSTTLVLLEKTKNGPSFLTPRVVLREGIEVGAVDTLSDTPNVIRSLGVVGAIAAVSRIDVDHHAL
ncbi:MAG: hypothetical protein HZB75_03845 [Candidatus Saccharibacteria bacterium]|nr:MAG: hypothetical protein HZB75_03845 [Candidatus Saccharibacteria bacterium]